MVTVQYDGHVSLIEGLDSRPTLPAPFTSDTVDKYSKGGIPLTVVGDKAYLYSDLGDGSYLVPTGLLARLLHKPHMDRPTIKRNTESIVLSNNLALNPSLYIYQARAIQTALRKKRCVISIPTGGGKSWVIEELCRVLGKVLVLVPTKLLLYQMQEQLRVWSPGLIGDGHYDIGKDITIAIPDTICNRESDPLLRAWLACIPALIVDECHTFSCPSGTLISSLMRGTQYRIGLSATPCMDNLLEGLIGALEYVVKEQDLIASGHILAPSVMVVKAPPILEPIPYYLISWFERCTTFNPMLYQSLYNHCILHNTARNILIADLAREYVNGDNGPLIVVVSRIEDAPPRKVKGREVPGKVSHASILKPLFEARGLDYVTLSGTSPNKKKEAIIKGLGDGSLKVVIAGASILKEGVNILQASGTIIAGAGRGGSEQAGLIQQVGRLLRPAPGKGKPTLYIIKDECHPLFSSQSRTLVNTCKKVYGDECIGDYNPPKKSDLCSIR